MRWTALVPIKQGGAAKSRLGAALAAPARAALVAWMADRVLAALDRCPAVGEVVVLSPAAPASPAGPACPAARWARDRGRGLNRELAAFRRGFGPAPLLVVHADLPLLAAADLAVLLARAERHGAALATDRAGHGTNALALADGRAFTFGFGPGSRARHCAQDAALPVVDILGLSADLDTVEDLDFLRARGLDPAGPVGGKVEPPAR